MWHKASARAPRWAVVVVLVLLLATTALAAAQSPDLLLPLVTGGGQAEQVKPEIVVDGVVPPLVEEEIDPNAPVGDSRDTHSGDQALDLPAEMATIDAFNATQWTVQNNVGIGTDAPTADIDLSRNVDTYTRIWVRNPNAGGNAQSQLALTTANSSSLALQQFGSGFSASWNGKSLKNMARLRTSPSIQGLILTTGGTAPLILGTGDIEHMRIASTGRIGIGTTNPALVYRMTVAGANTLSGISVIDAKSGLNVNSPSEDGVVVNSPGHNGVNINLPFNDGVYVNESGRFGVYVQNPGGHGVYIEHAGHDGVYVDTPDDDGVRVIQPGIDGVNVFQSGDDGVYVQNPGGHGVRVECPCGDATNPNTGVLVQDGNIRVKNGSFIDTGTILNVPDYVFEPDYPLLSLDELREYVVEEKHLPNVPDEEEIRAGGLDLSDFQMKLLEKTEELTLYTLAQDEQIKSLQQENEAMQQENLAKDEQLASMQEMIADLEARLAALEAQE